MGRKKGEDGTLRQRRQRNRASRRLLDGFGCEKHAREDRDEWDCESRSGVVACAAQHREHPWADRCALADGIVSPFPGLLERHACASRESLLFLGQGRKEALDQVRVGWRVEVGAVAAHTRASGGRVAPDEFSAQVPRAGEQQREWVRRDVSPGLGDRTD